MERVLGVDDRSEPEGVHTEVIDLAIQPWLAGMMISAVQLTLNGVRPRRSRTRNRR